MTLTWELNMCAIAIAPLDIPCLDLLDPADLVALSADLSSCPDTTILLEPIDVDGNDDDVKCCVLMDTSDVLPPPQIDEIFEKVHEEPPRQPRGSSTPDDRNRRRRERRQRPSAKAKESFGRKRRKERKDVLRQRWFRTERTHRALAEQCLAHARTFEERQLCIRLLLASNKVVERSLTLCPRSMREQLNSLTPWEFALSARL